MQYKFLGKTIAVNLLQASIPNTLPAPASYTKNNFSREICPDDIVASVQCVNGQWDFVSGANKIGQNATTNSVIDYNNITKAHYVVFVLESPHYWEYDKITHQPLGPAQASTGALFDKWICSILNGSNTKLTMKKSNEYKIVLMNAVQYQASTGVTPINENERNQNWLHFWNDGFNQDLINRLKFLEKTAKSLLVVNCVTGGRINKDSLHMLVDDSINQFGENHYFSTHPSCWFLPDNRWIDQTQNK